MRPTRNTGVNKGAVVVLATLLVACVIRVRPAAGQFDNTTRSVNKRGTTAADFLGIPVGARAAAMGGALAASVDDLSSLYWNPGGLSKVSGGAATVEYATWLADVEFTFFALAQEFGAGTFALGLTSMRTPEMEVTTVAAQEGTGETFDASSYALALSYARPLTDRFGIGASVKLISERIWNSSASGVAFDVGTTFVTPFRGVRLGASISNFGTKMRLSGDDLLVKVDIDPNNGGNNESNRASLNTDAFDLPLTMRIGLASDIVSNESTRFTLAVDALNPNNSEQYVNIGAEVGLLGDLFQVRGGYSELFLGDPVRSWTVGAGLRYRFAPLNLAVDYSYEVMEYFSDVSRFTVSLQW
jgi:hypothetical protein